MSFLDNLTAQLPFSKKSDEAEYFLALNIGLSQVTAAVWTIYGNELDILGQATLSYHGTEDLIEKAHQALDRSLGALEIDPQKILFGVSDSWSVEDNLKEPYLKLLRRMLKEYELEPMAYVTTTNAMTNLLQKQEGIPPTAILLGIGDFVEVTLARGGKVIETRSTERSDHLFGDIEKVLGQFTEVEVLPSKLLLYSTKNGQNLSKLRDELMSYPWMQKLSFLHFPKIEMLDDEAEIKGIVFAGAIEIHPEVNLKHSFSSVRQAAEAGGMLHGRKSLAHKDKEDEADLGFVKGDIKEWVKPKSVGDTLEEMGEKLEEPLNEETLAEESATRKRTLSRLPESRIKLPEQSMEWAEEVENEGKKLFAQAGLSGLTKKATSLLGGRKKTSIKIGGILTKFALIPSGLIILIAAYVFLVKVSVIVLVDPRVLEKTAEVVADPKVNSVDETAKVIPGSVVEITVSGSGKAAATGSKQIGDPAKGKVVIYNLTNTSVSLSQGTTLTSGSLKFSLDTSVKVASQSSTIGADLTTVIKPGKSDQIGVTASAIGPDSNLSAGTDLSFGNYTKSQVVARVEEALSGGTSKNVTVVTADDQKKLQAQVLNDLRQKAEGELQGKLSEGQKIISEGLSVVDGKYNFNKQANDQASELSLTANVRFKGTAYLEADLKTIVAKLVETNVPEGFKLNLQDTETQADVARVEKDGKLVFNAKFRAKLMPMFNLEDIKKQMKGKSVSDVASLLGSLENVTGSQIKFTPSLPDSLARFPILDQNILITVAPK